MDTLTAFAMGEANRHRRLKVFDWIKAADLIREHRPSVAEAGLAKDWEYTGGVIYAEGQPVTDQYTFLHSTWAIPTLLMEGRDYSCWRYEDDQEWGWTSDTKWPVEALKVLKGEQ